MIRGESLIVPASSCRIVPVRDRRGGTVDLEGLRLNIPAFADETGNIRAVAAAACTLGPALEARITELFRLRQPSLALAMDEIGTDRLFRLADRVIAGIGRDAKRGGLEAGAEINPGDAGLALDDQAQVLALAQAHCAGISLAPHGMLAPVKSLSMLVPLGEGLRPRAASGRCNCCPSRDRCAIRPR